MWKQACFWGGCRTAFRVVLPVPNSQDVDIYVTVELVDRLYPPPGKALAFPIPIDLFKPWLKMPDQAPDSGGRPDGDAEK